jgi:hypothetical protein
MENTPSDDYRLRIRKASEALALAQYQESLAKIAVMFPLPEDKDAICSSQPGASFAKIEPTPPLVTESPTE